MGVNGENAKMWNILKTVDRWSKTEENLGLGVLGSAYVRYFWCPIAWAWLGGNAVHFAKFPILWFFEMLLLQQFSSDFNEASYNVSQSGADIGYYFIWWSAKNYKEIWHFETFLNTGPYGAGSFKTLFLPQILITCGLNFMAILHTIDIAYHRGISAVTFLGNRSGFTKYI